VHDDYEVFVVYDYKAVSIGALSLAPLDSIRVEGRPLTLQRLPEGGDPAYKGNGNITLCMEGIQISSILLISALTAKLILF
jgi:hypothetical protein